MSWTPSVSNYLNWVGCVVNIQANPPIADFSAEPLSGISPLAVSFTDLSSGSPTSWLWNFGDGHTSTNQNPFHVYQNPGWYDVTLTAGRGPMSDTEIKIRYIRVRAFGIETRDLAVQEYREDAGYVASTEQLNMSFPKNGGVRCAILPNATNPIGEGFSRPGASASISYQRNDDDDEI